jgi:uncharacterized membrane protein
MTLASIKSLTTLRKWALGLSLVGLLVSIALELVHYRAYSAPSAASFCSIGERLDCASVALSRHSVLLNVPLALWGVVGFLTIGAAALLGSRWLLPLACVAAAGSLALLAVELLDVGAVCLLCEAVHVVSFALLYVAFMIERRERATLATFAATWLLLVPAAATLVVLGLALPRYWGAFGWKGEVPFTHGKTPEGDPWIGAEEPKLTLVEFTDYSCPHCAAASAYTLRQLAKHSRALRIVRAQYPRMPCEPRTEARCLAVRMALCADEQDKFWQADRWLFAHAALSRDLDSAGAARDLGLSHERFSACLDRDDIFARAAQASRRAIKLRLPGTPYYQVEGKLITQAEVAKLLSAL